MDEHGVEPVIAMAEPGGGGRGAGGRGADATCGRPESDGDAPGTPRERGRRAATVEDHRKNPNCPNKRQREGAEIGRAHV